VQPKIKITYVGHSMGGMTLPIYLIHRNVSKQPHYLSKAILMSPAGFHTIERVTPYLHVIGKFFSDVMPYFCSHFHVPDCVVSLASKIMKDVTMGPASRDLLAYMVSLVVGGDSTGETFVQSTRVTHAILEFGFSFGIP
jgi:hypothetical protein